MYLILNDRKYIMCVRTLCKNILPGVKYTQFSLNTIVNQLMVSYSNTQCLLIIYIFGIKHFIFPSEIIFSSNYFFWFYFTLLHLLTPKAFLHEILMTAIIFNKWAMITMITTNNQCWLLVCYIWLHDNDLLQSLNYSGYFYPCIKL